MVVSNPPDLVLVTGATGYIGTHVVLCLHSAQYQIRGTARSAARAASWTARHPQVPIEWVIVPEQADKGAFDEAVTGCHACIHAMGPFHLDFGTAAELCIPARDGVLNLLQAASQEPQMKRIVLNASLAAMTDHDAGLGVGLHVDETVWNPAQWDDTCNGEKSKPYIYCASKKFAEAAAWDYMASHDLHFDLVTLCPASNFGPPLQALTTLDQLDFATKRFYAYINGSTKECPPTPYPTWVAVQDTAKAHLKALSSVHAGGQRYMLVGGHYSNAQIIAILRAAFVDKAHLLAKVDGTGLPLEPQYTTDTSKAEKELGMEWQSLQSTVIAAASYLWELEATLSAKTT